MFERGEEEGFFIFSCISLLVGESRDVGRREIEDFQKEEEEEEEGGGDSRTGSDWSRGGKKRRRGRSRSKHSRRRVLPRKGEGGAKFRLARVLSQPEMRGRRREGGERCRAFWTLIQDEFSDWLHWYV